jgi:hypothetical protein
MPDLPGNKADPGPGRRLNDGVLASLFMIVVD